MISPVARAALKAIEEDTVQVSFLDRVDGVAHPAVAAALGRTDASHTATTADAATRRHPSPPVA
jgi:hypothetical protein